MSEVLQCPVCGRKPDIDVVTGWPRDRKAFGKPPWYADCFAFGNDEHCVGASGDTKQEAIRNWNAQVSRLRAEVVSK